MGRHWTPNRSQALLSATIVGFFVQGCEPKKPEPSQPKTESASELEPSTKKADEAENPDSEVKADSKEATGGTGGTGNPAKTPAGDTGEGSASSSEGGEANSDTGEGGKPAEADDGVKDTKKADPAVDKADEIKRLLSKSISTKTDDLEAMGALEQARQLGAKKSQLARSANRRGERLHASPDRAIRFFEWANRIDKRYATPSFNLAKVAANRGELPQAKVHLREVAARKGHKLLKTLEYDPTFAVLADDPEIRRLWQN